MQNDRSYDEIDLPLLLIAFFFFQAEDGIRDHCVTGVQTCALPIFMMPISRRRSRTAITRVLIMASEATASARLPKIRSEERRVGKECRYWWSPEHLKKRINRNYKLEIETK